MSGTQRDRGFYRVIVAATVLMLLSAGVSAQALEPVIVGISGHAINYLPAIIALEEGFTEKHGLQVTHLNLNGGTPTLQALVAGEFPIAIMSTTFVHGRLQGFDPVLIASFVPHMPHHLVTRAEIKTAEDLRGGRAAISTPGAIADGVTRLAITRLGLVPEQDVAILPMGGQTARLAALEAGTADATLLSPPLSYQLLEQGYNLLVDLMKEQVPSNHESIVTTERFLRENPELLKKYIRAIGDALHYIHTDREGTIQHIADYLQMDLVTERSIIERTYEEYTAYNFAKVPYPLITGMRNALQTASLQNPEVMNLDPWDLIDVRLVRELEEEGFFDQLYR